MFDALFEFIMNYLMGSKCQAFFILKRKMSSFHKDFIENKYDV